MQNQKLSSVILAEPILVGREKELEELKRCLDEAWSGKGVTIFISGEAGAGKTRLTTEFLNIAKKKPVTVLAGWCLSDVAIPYFPFIEAFDSYVSNNEVEGLSITNQQLSVKTWPIGNQSQAKETLGNTYPEAWKDQAFRAVAQELLFLSTKKPLILILEDIHWADSASLSLLHYLARQATSERILIIATFRSEELNAYVEGHPNPLSKELLLMGREDLYREVKLTNLSRDDVRRVAENMLGGLVHSDFEKKLAANTMGNPLFLVESLRMMHQQGSLYKTNGKWSLRVDNFEIPKKVKDVILRRLEALKSDQRLILNAASVVGEKFDPKLIAAVVSQDNIGVLATLNEIAKTTLMINCDTNCCRFDHAKSREMIYEEIPPLLRKEYHLRIAQRIEADSQEADGFSINDLAFHYDEAGNKEKALKYSLQAGQIALSRFSNVEAIKHFKYVLESISKNPENAEARRTAQEGLGDAYYANSMFKEAMRTFEELSKNETGVVKLRAFRKAMECAFQCMNIPRLMELVKEAEPYAAADRLESARVLMSRGRVYIMQHLVTLAPEDRMHALEDMGAALRVFEEEYSLWDAALALIGTGTMHPLFGEPQKGIAASLRSIALFEELGDFRFQMEACWAAGLVFEQMLLLNNEALGVLAKIIEIDEKMKMGDYNRLVYASAFSASAHEQMGDWEGALSFSLKALEASKKTDNFIAPGIVYANLCREYVRLGDLEQAEEYFEKLIKLPPEVQKNILTKGELTKAVFFAGKGRWKESNQLFKDHIGCAKLDQVLGDEVRGRLFYAWALEREGRFEEAKAQLEGVQKLYRDTEEMFAHVSLQASLMVPKKVNVGQIFEARLCIVNVSRGQGLLVRVENDLHPEFRVRNLPQEHTTKNEFFDEKERKLEPFQVTTLKVKLEATKTGVFNFNLKVVYRDDLGRIRICNPEQYNITVEPENVGVRRQELIAPGLAGKPLVITSESEKAAAGPAAIFGAKFEFASEPSKMAFDYLVSAFVEDYMRRRIAQEKAGWRSLMRIITEGKLSRSCMYGYGGRRGRALIELESRGLVEARFFPGERGRGGKILKLRVAYEKEIIKRIIDNRIMNKKNQ